MIKKLRHKVLVDKIMTNTVLELSENCDGAKTSNYTVKYSISITSKIVYQVQGRSTVGPANSKDHFLTTYSRNKYFTYYRKVIFTSKYWV